MGGSMQSSSHSDTSFHHANVPEFIGNSAIRNRKTHNNYGNNHIIINKLLATQIYSADFQRELEDPLDSSNRQIVKSSSGKRNRIRSGSLRRKHRNNGYGIINEQSGVYNCHDEWIRKVHSVCKTVDLLEKSLKISRSLEAEQWLRYSKLKAHDMTAVHDLKKANKLNKNMLNLFRQSVTDIRFGNNDFLPESLKREVQRTWHQKYDALLKKKEQMESEVSAMHFVVKDKDKQIESLQQKLLNLAETVIERDEAVKNINANYLSLKRHKDEQEILLRGTIENLLGKLQKVKSEDSRRKSEAHQASAKESLLAKEIRRNERLTHENLTLRALLHDARRGCKNSRSTSTISM